MSDKKIVSINLDQDVHKEAFRLANYHGYRSFSDLVNSLLSEWLLKVTNKTEEEK